MDGATIKEFSGQEEVITGEVKGDEKLPFQYLSGLPFKLFPFVRSLPPLHCFQTCWYLLRIHRRRWREKKDE